MRAVKSVLVAAGQLKRKEPESNEDLLLIRAMRDSNVPKFLEHDLPLFHGIVCDLFPGVVVPYVDYGVLQQAIEAVLQDEQLQKIPSFISKIIQVHETQLVRHGMMVVGEAGSGKSANVTVLAKALSRLHSDGVEDRDGFYKQVDRLQLNPKSITAGKMKARDALVVRLPRCVRSAFGRMKHGDIAFALRKEHNFSQLAAKPPLALHSTVVCPPASFTKALQRKLGAYRWSLRFQFEC